MALPTPAQVKALPLSAVLKLVFASIPDDAIQELIDLVAGWFGSAEVKRHTQRDKAVLYGTAHLLYTQLAAEGLVPGGGGGGGGGPLSSVTLQGVGSKSWAVQAFKPAELGDWLLQWSPWKIPLQGILDTFPPGIAVAHMPLGGVPPI